MRVRAELLVVLASFIFSFQAVAQEPAGTDEEMRRIVAASPTVIDTADSIGNPVFSRDGANVYYGRTKARRSEVVVRDLHSGRALATYGTKELAVNLGLSPDGKRLLLCSQRNAASILDTVARQQVDLGTTLSDCNNADLYWDDPNKVSVMRGRNSYVFNLEDFTEKDLYLVDGWAPSLSAGELEEAVQEARRAHFDISVRTWELMRDNDGVYVYAVSSKNDYSRRLFVSGLGRVSISPDRKYVLSTAGGSMAYPSMKLRQVALTWTGPPNPNGFTFVPGPDAMARIDAEIARGRYVGARIFEAQINPLNQRAVGPVTTDYSEQKAWGIVEKSEGKYRIRVRTENSPLSSADVVAQFWSWFSDVDYKDLSNLGWYQLGPAVEVKPATSPDFSP